MSLNLKSFYPQFKNQTGSIAYEVELESHKQVYPEAEGWSTGGDNSLRYYGIEIKSREPVKEASISKHLASLDASLKNYDWILPSPRTSVHTHVNVLGLTPVEIFTSAAAYWLFEPVFFALCDDTRKGNLFCLRLKDAYGLVYMIEEDIQGTMMKGTVPFNVFNNPDHRYAALNLASVCKFGSLEFRSLHGTTDVALMERWGKMCLATTYRSGRYKNPRLLIDAVLNEGYDKVRSTIFGPGLTDDIKITSSEQDEQVEMLLDYASLVDWDAYEKSLEKASKSGKKKLSPEDQILQAARELNRRPAHRVNAVGGGGGVALGRAIDWNVMEDLNVEARIVEQEFVNDDDGEE